MGSEEEEEEEAELGNKRRLPLWMSSSSSSSSTTKRKETSISISISISTSMEEDGEKEEEFVPTTSLKPRATTRKRAKKEQQLPPIVEQGKATTTRKKHVANKPKTRRHKFTEQEEEDMVTDSVSTQKEEEEDYNGDLTVDDLITIAQEYVKADVEKENHPKQQQQLTRRVELSNISGGGSALNGCTSNDVVESTEVLPTMRHLSDEAMAVSQGTTTSSSTKTGDPTQDMLDLLLGPLLKKPTQTREAIKESEAAACAKFREEIVLDEYICSQKKQSEQKEEADMGKPEPLPMNITKKKSSLRDKVAMFFDCD